MNIAETSQPVVLDDHNRSLEGGPVLPRGEQPITMG